MKEENKRRALGRGLEELFSIEDINYGNLEEKIMETVHEEEIQELPLSELRVNPYQPRKTFNEESLNELAESIKEHGVFQPIIVKKSIKGYEIVAGERRFRASKLAGKETIPAIVRNFTDEEMMEIAVLENLQRENLNAVDEANAYKTLMENLHLTQDQVSKRVNKSRSHITNLLGILALPEDVLTLVKENKLTMGHARCLSKLSDIEKINELTKKVLEENLSVRELEALASGEEIERKNKIVKKPKSNEYTSLEKELTEYYGTKVKIANKKLIISFENNQDLNRILEMINYNK
ncbi:MAG: ParB/RepB/Spo0J family partition protein [Bacilli bacterium]|nr:ParB/RepB/Spo0J family partition protein [Mycoplasmatota bacterium]MDY4237237.1 ParB/RepB/Spo0J family partition protein [Bacilli bacterium]